MTSRHALWLALGLAALPLFYEATIGCQYTPPTGSSQEELEDNALQCACSCDANGMRSRAIQADFDDAEQNGAAMDRASGDLDLGSQIVGLRFAGVMIPPGATIQSASVQFTAQANDAGATNVTIDAEQNVNAGTFTNTNNDLSGRTGGTQSVLWNINTAWTTNAAGPAQQTPDLSAVLQELVMLPGWSEGSAVVLRFTPGAGQRAAHSFDGNEAKAAVLVVSFGTSVAATFPVCASPGVALNADGSITTAELTAECARVEQTLEGLAQACAYPTPCSCAVVDVPDQDDSFDSVECGNPCTPVPVDGTCSNFDPNAFSDCLAGGGTVASCKHFIAATHAGTDSTKAICVASGDPLAFQMYGRRSQCDVAGTSEVEVGDREPKHDPATTGIVEILGGPCPGGGCVVYPYLNLTMDPIEFEVRFASNPTFSNLSASGRALNGALLVGTGATFLEDAIQGTGNGRRNDADKLAVTATNEAPLALGVNWGAHSCDLVGNLAATVDGEVPDGTCEDDTTVCVQDSPDCDGIGGGTCVFDPDDIEQMLINVSLLNGTLVNQPPMAAAGADQTHECTSPAGFPFMLDGRGSSDPDGNLVASSWRLGTRIGPLVSTDLLVPQTVGVGVTKSYVLRVIDAFAQADEDDAKLAVVDTVPPSILAQWVPLPPLGQSKFRLDFSATDVCDPAPMLTGVVKTPPLAGLKIKKRIFSNLKVEFFLKLKEVRIDAPNPNAIVTQLQTYGGLLVNSGQRVIVRRPDPGQQDFEFENGTLTIETLTPALVVTAKDVSGNMATTQVTP